MTNQHSSGLQRFSFESSAKALDPILPSGDQSVVEPPGPIPNPEVKRRSADGSGTIGPVRVGRRQVFARHLRKKVPGSFFAPNQQACVRANVQACNPSPSRLDAERVTGRERLQIRLEIEVRSPLS